MRRTGWVDSFARWWREPGRYDWLVALVEANGYGLLTRLGVSLACVAIGAWPILMAFSPQGVAGADSRVLTVSCGVLALLLGCWWLIRWPTRRESTFIVVLLNGSIAISCVPYVLEGKPAVGTLAFALTASYVACVHARPQLIAVVSLASTVIIAGIVRSATDGDLPGGLAYGLLKLAAVTVVPMTVRTLVDLLGETAVVSDIDPLTGLANRRGLMRAVRQLVGAAAGEQPTDVCVTMIDIDNFKEINDTRGHAAGDQVLVELGKLLHEKGPADAIVARIGGEEFVIVALCEVDGAVRVAESVGAAMRAAESEFTASYGVATIELPGGAAVDAIVLTERLLSAADDAMYLAKRAGGDRIRVARTTPR